jgi:hypothetical protein
MQESSIKPLRILLKLHSTLFHRRHLPIQFRRLILARDFPRIFGSLDSCAEQFRPAVFLRDFQTAANRWNDERLSEWAVAPSSTFLLLVT